MVVRPCVFVAVYLTLLVLLAAPLGRYIARVFAGTNRWTARVLGGVEALVYRVAGIDPDEEHTWGAYALVLLAFTLGTHAVTYVFLRTQSWLPGNPTHLGNLPPWLAFNTTVGFETGTAWESFAPEATLTTFSQVVALVSQNFFSPAVAIATAVALVRGITRHERTTVGNAWVDLVRAHLYVLVPLCGLFALGFVSQGVVDTWAAPARWVTLDGASEVMLRGPVAALEAIKIVGSNGEGYFNANSAHPWENPTALCNLLQLLAILLVPAALCVTLGEMAGHRRHGRALLAAVIVLLVAGAAVITQSEQAGNPVMDSLGVDSLGVDSLGHGAAAGAAHPGGNMEGKELRFGIAGSAVFAEATTASSCGAVNSMHDSYTPVGGLVPMVNMQLGEVVFGGAGCGLYGLVVFVLITIFLAGLMIGRTPEYLGKKLDARDVRMASLVVLIPAFSILGFTALAMLTDAGRAGIFNTSAAVVPGTSWRAHPHGLSEVLYAYSSATGNNGSTFAGMTFASVQHPVFYSLTLALAMFLGRFPVIVAVLAIAGNMAQKKRAAHGAQSFPVDGMLFVTLLIAVIVLVGALTFFPALALGPVVEHFILHRAPG